MTYRFDSFVLQNNVLRLKGRKTLLRPKHVKVLRFLIDRRDRLVGREELMHEFWPGPDADPQNLYTAISAIRVILEDDPSDPQFVLTDRDSEGFQFIGKVDEIDHKELRRLVSVGSTDGAASPPSQARTTLPGPTVTTVPIRDERLIGISDIATRLALEVSEVTPTPKPSSFPPRLIPSWHRVFGIEPEGGTADYIYRTNKELPEGWRHESDGSLIGQPATHSDRSVGASERPTVVLADGHAIVGEAVTVMLEAGGIVVVGQARDGQTAVRMTAQTKPDVAILEFSLPTLNGIDAMRRIAEASKHTAVAFLTDWAGDRKILVALHHGARGMISKSQDTSELVHAIRIIGRGGAYFGPSFARSIVAAYRRNVVLCDNDNMTLRERELLTLVAEGHSEDDVARQLGLSIKGANACRLRLIAKLGVAGTAGLVRYAVRLGLVEPGFDL